MNQALAPEDVLTPKQLEALQAQQDSSEELAVSRALGITTSAFKARLTRARRILQSVGLDPQWRRTCK
jgi:hypothetical protein